LGIVDPLLGCGFRREKLKLNGDLMMLTMVCKMTEMYRRKIYKKVLG